MGERRQRRARRQIPLLLFLVCTLCLQGCRRGTLTFEQAQVTLPADGRMHLWLALRRKDGRALSAREVGHTDGPNGVSLEQGDEHSVKALIRAPVTPQNALLHLRWRRQSYALRVQFVRDDLDSYADGTPDFLRLHTAEDRRAFRSWLVAIGEQEARLPAGQLPTEINDCSALLRYAYREALVSHDASWLNAQPFPEHFQSLASVTQYHYPQTPLAAALFRVKAGPFVWSDVSDGSFAQFADAQTLMRNNTYFVSRDIRTAQPGDLLFFRQFEQNSPYHSMIVTGTHAEWLIYHTGPIGRSKGEIRRVAVEDLLHHPDARWRPVPGNTNFLGVYRWNVLRDGD